MGTAGGEPRVLLNALKPMLGVVGDIKTPQEVMRVVGMMKDAEVRSIILVIILLTNLARFCGGYDRVQDLGTI